MEITSAVPGFEFAMRQPTQAASRPESNDFENILNQECERSPEPPESPPESPPPIEATKNEEADPNEPIALGIPQDLESPEPAIDPEGLLLASLQPSAATMLNPIAVVMVKADEAAVPVSAAPIAINAPVDLPQTQVAPTPVLSVPLTVPLEAINFWTDAPTPVVAALPLANVQPEISTAQSNLKVSAEPSTAPKPTILDSRNSELVNKASQVAPAISTVLNPTKIETAIPSAELVADLQFIGTPIKRQTVETKPPLVISPSPVEQIAETPVLAVVGQPKGPPVTDARSALGVVQTAGQPKLTPTVQELKPVQELNPVQVEAEIAPHLLFKAAEQHAVIDTQKLVASELPKAKVVDSPVKTEAQSSALPIATDSVELAPSPVEPKLDTSKTLRQVSDEIANLAQHRSGGTVRILLQPEELGSILITVKSFGQKFDADITTTHEQVRSALDLGRSQLIAAVESRGLSMGSLNVGTHSQPSNSFALGGDRSHQSQGQANQAQQSQFLSRTPLQADGHTATVGWLRGSSSVDLQA